MSMEHTINRINELSRLQKSVGLNEQQKEEQAELRKTYLAAIKSSLKNQLDNIEIVDDLTK